MSNQLRLLIFVYLYGLIILCQQVYRFLNYYNMRINMSFSIWYFQLTFAA